MQKTASFPAAKHSKCAKNNCQYVHSFLPTNILLHTRNVYTKKTQQTEWNRGQNQVKKVHENVWNEQKRDFPFTHLYCIIIYFTTYQAFPCNHGYKFNMRIRKFYCDKWHLLFFIKITHSIPVLFLRNGKFVLHEHLSLLTLKMLTANSLPYIFLLTHFCSTS